MTATAMGVPAAGGRGRARRGAALGLVFGAVLLSGAAAGAWGGTAPVRPAVPAGNATASGQRSQGSEDGQDGHRGLDGGAPPAAALTPQQAERLVAVGGDRWAAYYSPQEYAEFAQGLDGEYLGVGLFVDRAADGSTVVAELTPGSPAAAAGIAVGERLLAVDGAPVDRLPVTEVVARLRGRPDTPAEPGRAAGPGSAVRLTLRRPGAAPREVTLRRAVLAAQDVAVDHPAAGVLWITARAFTTGVGAEIAAAVRRSPEHGVVLDLRGNSGGLVAEAVATASVFLDGGPVASYLAGGERRELTAAPGGDARTPLVVLVDGGTMSAAELLAGALQDRCRAVLVGSRTFGKGTVQQPSRLADGSVLELTVGRWSTPAGRSPDGTGLLPDVPAADPGSADALALRVLSGLGEVAARP
ncbi:S41 family peptidase [Kitasatospora sp. NBC_01287]|uniref:S41 family peptidase n=1 Tax=Kitasatospora sp. NBC_01287 TaxID=2903573 RepID=UPI00224E9E13|nr:S41 family peptidase [Kitasatospora sp. NBC_01287]MCX4748730.1 S41 family peptidase [Kitasatospora sp. NBC_01287]